MTNPKSTTSRPAKDSRPGCNVPDCRREPTTRGLCAAHWATHRGLANPRGKDD